MIDPKAEGESLGGQHLGVTAEGWHVFHVMRKVDRITFEEAGYKHGSYVLVDQDKKPIQTAFGYAMVS